MRVIMKRKVNTINMFLFAFFVALFAFAFYWGKERHEATVLLTRIAQTGPRKEAFRTDYLAAILGLCAESRIPLATIDLEVARKKLLSHPLIECAQLSKGKEGTLRIDYTLRQPYVLLGDFSNCVLDAKGFAFPFSPFFLPRRK